MTNPVKEEHSCSGNLKEEVPSALEVLADVKRKERMKLDPWEVELMAHQQGEHVEVLGQLREIGAWGNAGKVQHPLVH